MKKIALKAKSLMRVSTANHGVLAEPSTGSGPAAGFPPLNMLSSSLWIFSVSWASPHPSSRWYPGKVRRDVPLRERCSLPPFGGLRQDAIANRRTIENIIFPDID